MSDVTMSNVTCPPGNTLPEIASLPIPQNIPVIVIPGSNASDVSMVNCCYPEPVAVADSCYEWCEVPKNTSVMEFGNCLRINGKTNNQSSIVGFQSDAPPAPSATIMKLGLWTLLVSGLVALY